VLRQRFSRLGLKKLPGSMAYLADGSIRELLGFSEQRREPPLWAHLYGGGTFSGVPNLSEPRGTYELGELKAEILKRKWYGIGETRKAFKQQLDSSATFEEVHGLCFKAF
jgi:hypothetical protein